MSKDELNKLEELLINWFNSADFDKPHFLERDKIAKLIRKELNKRNRWAAKRAPSRINHLRKYYFK